MRAARARARAYRCPLTRDRQAGTYISRGGARGCTDQSEASILYPAEYLGRMPHVRGVVWGHPCTPSLSLSLSPSFFLSFSSGRCIFHVRDDAQRRRANVLRRPFAVTFLRISRRDNRAFPRETEEQSGGNSLSKRFRRTFDVLVSFGRSGASKGSLADSRFNEVCEITIGR